MQQTVTTTYSDLSGEAGADTHHLTFDGVPYVVDLTRDEHDELAQLLAPYLTRKVPLARRRRSKRQAN